MRWVRSGYACPSAQVTACFVFVWHNREALMCVSCVYSRLCADGSVFTRVLSRFPCVTQKDLRLSCSLDLFRHSSTDNSQTFHFPFSSLSLSSITVHLYTLFIVISTTHLLTYLALKTFPHPSTSHCLFSASVCSFTFPIMSVLHKVLTRSAVRSALPKVCHTPSPLSINIFPPVGS
jgi:hypothetical protein